MTDQAEGSRRPNRLQVIEANLLGGATAGQIAAALGEPVEATTAAILEMAAGWRQEWAALGATQVEVNLRRVDLAINALWSSKAVQSGDTGAIAQALKLMELRDELLARVPVDPFPAGERAPGQAESRSAYGRFVGLGEKIPWWRDYLAILERLAVRKAAGEIDRADWRLAAYLAWASSPVTGRWPETEQELAPQVLGLKSARTIRKWKGMYPWIEEEIVFWQAAPLMRHRRDAFETLTHGVQQKDDPRYFQYLKLYLEMTGDYAPKGSLDLRASAAVDLAVQKLTEEELNAILSNFLIAAGYQRGAGHQTDGHAGAGTDAGQAGSD